MEDVVALFLEREKRRHKEAKDDENQAEVVIGCRQSPVGLYEVIDSMAHRLGITQSLLTRCLSHQVISWYDSIPGLQLLVTEYYDAHDKAIVIGKPELCSRLSNSGYSFSKSSASPVYLKSITWVRSKLTSLSRPLSVPVGLLFLAGLCWSLSCSADESYRVVGSAFKSEADGLASYVEERFILVRDFHKLVEYHIQKGSL